MRVLLQDYLTRSAERHPEKVAVVMGDERLTYEELALQSGRLARVLRENGCRRGDRVCLLLPKSPTAIAGMIGVLEAGGAYVPIDVASPAARVQSIAEACEPQLILACEETTELAQELARRCALPVRVGLLDDCPGPASLEPVFRRADWMAVEPDPPQRGDSADDLAHILFTSGSTGVPKGVTITHSNVIQFVEWATAYFGTASSDRISGHPPLHFDLSTFDIFGTLLAGAELHLVPAQASFEPATLVDFIRAGELTQWFSVPSALTFMVKYGAFGQDDFPNLKRVIWCGEVLPTPTLIEWMRRLGHVEFTNLYGPTEATIASSYFRVTSIPVDPTAAIPIGEACAGEQLEVLDEQLRPLPRGEVGEIHIGGVGLSPGYWRDVEKTTAAFRGREEPGGGVTRLYRTGDLGYRGEDDLFYILGRTDSQIKSRGYRIELGEIEAALNAQEAIRECAVVGVQVGGFVGTAICCAYAPIDREDLTPVDLRERLASRLPTYMLPSHWLSLEALPKNLNGKIDRRELRERFEREVEAAGTEEEIGALAAQLAGIPQAEWDARVLEVVQRQAADILIHLSWEAVEPERAFKELGLDSLGAVELSSRLGEATGLHLAPTAIFDHPTPAAVAKLLRSLVEGVQPSVGLAPRAPSSVDEPIAIVGMSCRYPGGVHSPADLWRLLVREGDAIGEFPKDRGWDLEALYDPDPDRPGTSYARHGGFVRDAQEFDAAFFSIAPREALAMDPQQRLLLEGAWESLEDAGIDPSTLRGSSTGVFAGVVSVFIPDGQRYLGAEELEGYWLTGSSASVVSGRVSYTLGLEGPAVSVDTACSSSLVAVHLACQALRCGECSLALAGGVTVLSAPDVFIAFSRQRALSPDGRCKSFASAADGTGWSEGVGLLTLERLSDAERNGREVLGLVRASATNQDGASNGLTAPSGPSQEQVIRRALASGGISASEVDAVEAHGTGTKLGDPIEAQALLATYGRDRPRGRPLYLGSLKSNLGHTQAAAGVGGVIKMVEAMRHGVLPKTLHVDEPSAHVDWSQGEVELLSEAKPWPAGERPRRAGVSSFGVSGTNAHLILEEAPGGEATGGAGADGVLAEGVLEESALPWVLSGRGEHALRAQAGHLAAFAAEDPDLSAVDIGFSLAGRTAFEDRAVVLGCERGELLGKLGALAREDDVEGVVRGHLPRRVDGGVVFVFSGQGGQWPGMAVELLDCSPAFARSMRDCEVALAEFVDWSLGGVLRGAPGAPSLDRVEVLQPTLFAIMVSLARLWGECGVRPSAVVGHSQGEIAAACVAGGLSLRDGARVVASRARALREVAGAGGMLAIAAGLAEVEPMLAAHGGRVSVAAVNGPGAVVVSGEPGALEELLGQCEAQELRARRIPVDYAAHSAQVEAVRAELAEGCAGIAPTVAEIPFYSTVTAGPLDTACLDADYWYRNLRETVQFERVTRELLGEGRRTYVEVSPHPVLSVALQETADEALGIGGGVGVIGSMRREDGGAERLLASLGEAWVRGAPVDWGALWAGSRARRVRLPTYAFQRERFRLEARARDAGALGQSAADHPLLGAAVGLAQEGWLFTGRLSLQTHAWLRDHAVMGTVLMPGTAFVELALAAAQRVGVQEIEELTLQVPLLLSEQGAVQLQLTVSEPDASGRREVAVYSRPEGTHREGVQGDWTRHAVGVLGVGTESPPADGALGALAAAEWPPAGAQALDRELFYERLAEAGYDYGPAFRGVQAAWTLGGELFAEVALNSEQAARAGAFCVHPALLDAAAHALVFQALDARGAGEIAIPFAFGGVRIYGSGASELRVRLGAALGTEAGAGAGAGALSLQALDRTGAPVLCVDSLLVRPIDRGQLRNAARGARGGLHSLRWIEARAGSTDGTKPRVVELGGGRGAALVPAGVAAERYLDLAALAAAIDAGTRAPEIVLVATSAGDERGELREVVHAVAERTLELLQAWIADERFAESKLVVLTSRAIVAWPDESPELATAALWGLLRSAQAEHPDRFALIDVDRAEDSARSLERALTAGEPQLALRDGVLYVPRFSPAAAPEQARLVPPLDPRGTVLITGGTGGLGARLARHLAAEHGARRLLLVSRRGELADGVGELGQELAELGCEARIVACDVSEREALAAVLAAIPAEHPLVAVIHAAGVLEDGVISSLDRERLRRVMAPKVDAALHLHELTAEMELSEFLMFSSVSATLGAPGQGNYAAANAFLDALAAHRRALGLPGKSLAWGAWAMAGAMAGDLDEVDRGRLGRMGVRPLSDERGLELFDLARRVEAPLLMAVDLDMAALRARAGEGTLPALMRGLVSAPVRRASGVRGSLAQRLAGAPEAEWETIVLELVLSNVAVVLGHASAQAVDATRPFKELGFDSLGAVELRNRLGGATGLRLASTLIFDHPTPVAVAEFLRSKVEGVEYGAAAAQAAPRRVEEPIAIVGMSCRFPGGVRSPADLWQLLVSERDPIGELPSDRGWDLEALYDPDPESPGTSYARHGGFLYDAGEFDAAFFSIAPREALAMDPQQRLFLEGAWEVLEDAGIDPSSLRGSQTGVFAGVMYHEYGSTLSGPALEELAGYLGTGAAGSVLSGRVSYTLGLEGPAVSVDTACSSSLVAMHLACQSLRTGECSLALAGGVTVMASPGTFVEFSAQRGLAPDGRCKSFAAGADGTGWSEGVGLVLLEGLSDARRNGHRVLGLVRGSATNQDGASNGLTAPNGPSQERVIRQALRSAGLSASEVDAVEAHGTGTTLGDSIEAQALLATYGQGRPEERPLLLGSVKSNLGHTQAAAGVAGVIKMVEALRRETLPKTLHVEEPSREVDWSAGAVSLLTHAEPWRRGRRPRRVGVSSFGISGTNAHMILEEAPPDDGRSAMVRPVQEESPPALAASSTVAAGPQVASTVMPWVISGRGAQALRAQAQRLREHVMANPDLDAGDVGYSLALSRAALRDRAVVVGGSRGELLGGVGALARGVGVDGVVRGVVGVGGERVAFLFTGQGAQRVGMGREL